MTVKRMDNVGIVVESLDAGIAFFTELGLQLEGRATIEGEWAGRITGLGQQRVEIAMLVTPDGTGMGATPNASRLLLGGWFGKEQGEATTKSLESKAAVESFIHWRTARCYRWGQLTDAGVDQGLWNTVAGRAFLYHLHVTVARALRVYHSHYNQEQCYGHRPYHAAREG